jgi:prevent-host-death family protein
MTALAASNDPDSPAHRLRVREVPVTELRRRAAAVIGGVVEGEAAVISKHGRPVAVVLPFPDGEKVLQHQVVPAELKELERMFARRVLLRELSDLRHGRVTWD